MLNNSVSESQTTDLDQFKTATRTEYYFPSKSITIERNPNKMLEQDDQDGSELINLINRSLQDFNDSLIEKNQPYRDDSAYNTAASSLSNQDMINYALIADEMHSKMVMPPQMRQNYHQQSTRTYSGDSHVPSWNSSSRRRLQSCSTIGSNPVSRDIMVSNHIIEAALKLKDSLEYSKTQEVLCHPKYCPESPIRLAPLSDKPHDASESLRRPKRVTAHSCSIDPSSQVAKGNRACSFYLRGHCKKEDCEFAHDLTKVTCRFWKTNSCIKGESCPFLHGYPPESDPSSQLSSSLPNQRSGFGIMQQRASGFHGF